MLFSSILALTDFSAAGDKALERAAQIALAHRATLRLMLLPADHETACLDPDTRLRQTAQALAMRLGTPVTAAGSVDGSPDALAAYARAGDLLVLPQRSRRSMTHWLAGPDAIRILRACPCPVLVARGAVRRRLRQVVVGVEFTPAAQQRAMLACLLAPGADVELFHAVDTHGESQLRQAEVDDAVLRNYRDNCMEHAQMRLRWMTQSLAALGHEVVTAALRGEPARQLVLRQQWIGADLLVVGKQRRHALFDAVLRSTAHQVLAQARCDVLLVPHDYVVSATAARPRPAVAQDPAGAAVAV
ncbi:MAG: universal stress protein [Burkholderiaceae bacterium]|nr:universal stress protein [Rhodoferax sp.]MCP5260391.1 universal stress protein [Rhodoferax sp.]MCW5629301.1 universal stress protein [Rhodoferax sp.]